MKIEINLIKEEVIVNLLNRLGYVWKNLVFAIYIVIVC